MDRPSPYSGGYPGSISISEMGYGFPGFPGMAGPEPDEEMSKLIKSDMDLERRTIELAQRYRTSPKEQKEELRKELSEVIDKHFDVRQEKRELQLKRMEASLVELRDAIQKRADAREEIVKKRLGDLVGEKSELEF